MKNWDVALSGALVRAIEIVPRRFLRPFLASFLMGSPVFFSVPLPSTGANPPPWIMKLLITR